MMTFGEWLQDHKEAIVRRWLDDALATYPEDACAAFKKQKDPFANPVGHSLRVGTAAIFDALVGGFDDDKIRQPLGEIVKIRAVQQFTPSEALAFVFRLKEAVRAELEKASDAPTVAGDLTKLEADVDRIALAAFDVFVECREQLYDLRVNEVKRRVSWVLDKMNGREPEPEPAGPVPE